MKRLPWSAVLLLTVACAGPAQQPEPPLITSRYVSLQCQGLPNQAGILEFTPAQWQRFLGEQQLSPGVLASYPTPVGRLVVINMGQRSSAGYGVSLVAERSSVQAGRLTLPVVWTLPAPGMMQAQVLTHPCAVVSVERAEFDFVSVVGQAGIVRLQGPLPSAQ